MNQQRYSSDELEIELQELIRSQAKDLVIGVIKPADIQDFVRRCIQEGVQRARICFQVMGSSYQDKIDRKSILYATLYSIEDKDKLYEALGITEEEANKLLEG